MAGWSLMFGRRPRGSHLIGIDGHTALVGVDHAWQVWGAGRGARHGAPGTQQAALRGGANGLAEFLIDGALWLSCTECCRARF